MTRRSSNVSSDPDSSQDIAVVKADSKVVHEQTDLTALINAVKSLASSSPKNDPETDFRVIAAKTLMVTPFLVYSYYISHTQVVMAYLALGGALYVVSPGLVGKVVQDTMNKAVNKVIETHFQRLESGRSGNTERLSDEK